MCVETVLEIKKKNQIYNFDKKKHSKKLGRKNWKQLSSERESAVRKTKEVTERANKKWQQLSVERQRAVSKERESQERAKSNWNKVI